MQLKTESDIHLTEIAQQSGSPYMYASTSSALFIYDCEPQANDIRVYRGLSDDVERARHCCRNQGISTALRSMICVMFHKTSCAERNSVARPLIYRGILPNVFRQRLTIAPEEQRIHIL